MNYTFQYSVVLDHLPYLIGGAIVTLEVAFLSFWLGAVIGLAGALAKLRGGKLLRGIVGAYVIFFTNTPALVQIFFLFYALPDVGILLDGTGLAQVAHHGALVGAGFDTAAQL